jgi:hypothetical protein
MEGFDTNRPRRRGRNEKGMALVIALMLLSVLSLLGASALLTTNVEVKITSNTKLGRIAFFAADGAGNAAAGILEDNITDVGWSDDFQYSDGVSVTDGDFAFEVRNEDDDGDGDTIDDVSDAPDISFDDTFTATVDVDKGPTVPVAGSSAVSATGFEGAGKGAAGGGLKTVYHLHTKGVFDTRAISLIFMTYDHYL